MATIESYQTSSGATLYAVRYRKPDNKQTWKRGFARKRDAELFAASVEVSKARGEFIAPTLGKVTVGELAPRWLARKKPPATAPSHHRMLESAWRVHVQPHWGKTAVADVDLLAVEEWITGMATKGAGCHHGAAGARRAVGHPGRRGEGQAVGGQPCQGGGEPAT